MPWDKIFFYLTFNVATATEAVDAYFIYNNVSLFIYFSKNGWQYCLRSIPH